jgi:hypothetical protein
VLLESARYGRLLLVSVVKVLIPFPSAFPAEAEQD